MLAVAETKEEVLEALKKDVYYTNKVWDWEKIQIWPVSFYSFWWLLGLAWFVLEGMWKEAKKEKRVGKRTRAQERGRSGRSEGIESMCCLTTSC